ncbi:amidohydrolase [Microbulbifer sp. GL-2]|uniref:amidohydrolase family protein n=1 Tax=Microbulbifer sp. GL-2 TaxID=2591606 RepID=UPI0011644822|nr:amidohydrolase family protein [Microbulbifer sp. GL-2]BBM03034.1 2-pyrone-4,6-dicarboxylate hydrolase [Microbulbifer sp. GL-2]
MKSDRVTLFDSHLHIITPGFPLYSNQGFTPEPFTTTDYLNRLKNYDLIGGAVVSGSFQKQDQTYLLDALARLGKGYVGVTQILSNTDDNTIIQLNKAGVRAVRFNLRRGGSEDISKVTSFAQRIYEIAGWHVELYIDSQQIVPLIPTLLALPKVSIDHLGLSKSGLKWLLQLAEQGVKVKATGFGRLDFEPASAILDLYKANPECLMFGSDLPSTRAPRPFRYEDIKLIQDALGEPASSKVFWKNAKAFYLGQE